MTQHSQNGEGVEAIDRLVRFARCPDSTIGEHDDIMTVVALARQSLTAREPATADAGREARARSAYRSALLDRSMDLAANPTVPHIEARDEAAVQAILRFADDEAALSRAAPSSERTRCEDCPPVGYPTDATRCNPCDRRAAPSSEPFGYWVEQKHAEPALLRKPAYIPESSDLRTVTPLYAAPSSGPEWCSKCGCGNDARGFAHLAACPTLSDDGPCTDCSDTGITHQTERACSCAAGDEYRAPSSGHAMAEVLTQSQINALMTLPSPGWKPDRVWSGRATNVPYSSTWRKSSKHWDAMHQLEDAGLVERKVSRGETLWRLTKPAGLAARTALETCNG